MYDIELVVDGENNILLDQFGDRSKNSPTDSEQGTR